MAPTATQAKPAAKNSEVGERAEQAAEQNQAVKGLQGEWGTLSVPTQRGHRAEVSTPIATEKAFENVQETLRNLKNVDQPNHPLVESVLHTLVKDKSKHDEFRDAAKEVASAILAHCEQMQDPKALQSYVQDYSSRGDLQQVGALADLAALAAGPEVNAREFTETFNESLKGVVAQLTHVSLVSKYNEKQLKEKKGEDKPAPLAVGQTAEQQEKLYEALKALSDNVQVETKEKKSFPLVKEAVAGVSAQILAARPKLRGQKTQININGNTSIEFNHEEELTTDTATQPNGTVVRIALSPSNVIATFKPPSSADVADTPEAKLAHEKKVAQYEQVCSLLQGQPLEGDVLINLNPVQFPNLTTSNNFNNLTEAYRSLFIASDGNVEFTSDASDSGSYISQQLESFLGDESTLLISSEREDSNTMLSTLNAEVAERESLTEQFAALKNGETILVERAIETGKEAVQTVSIRKEFGEVYVDLLTKADNTGNSATISFRLENDEAGTIQKLGAVLQEFEKEGDGPVSRSETIKGMLELGELSGVVSNDPKKTIVLENVTWLGEQLAPNAEFKGVEFRNSSLDFTGSGANFERCKFSDCRVAMRLENAHFEKSVFDSKTTLSGSISGVFDKTALYGNAYNLDWSKVSIQGLPRIMGVERYYTRAIFNSNTMPASFRGKTRPLSSRASNLMLDNLDSQFNGDSVRALIHQYSNDNLGSKTPLSNLVRKGGLVREYSMDVSKKNVQGENRVIPTIRTEKDDFEIIDVFPRDIKEVDKNAQAMDPNTRVLRLIIDKNNNVHYAAGTLGEVSKIESPLDPNLRAGNARAFQATLDFVHLGNDPTMDKDIGAVQVASDGVPDFEDPTQDVDDLTEAPTQPLSVHDILLPENGAETEPPRKKAKPGPRAEGSTVDKDAEEEVVTVVKKTDPNADTESDEDATGTGS